MAFLTPWYLLGLLGMGIPLAIHLIRRQKAERIALPTVRFLKRAPKKLVHFQKIQQWLLLALRVAIAGLLAVAFARPILSGAIPQMLGGTPQSLVIVIDTSMSMGYADRFQEAKTAVLSLLRSLQPGDAAAVIAFSDRPGPMHQLTTDLNEMELFVKTISPPGFHATHLLPALRLADQILRSAGTPLKTIYMVSDYQRSAAPDNTDPWTLSPGVRFKSIRVGDTDNANLAVTDVTISAYPADHKETHRVVGRIRNHGSGNITNVRVWLEIDGRQVAGEPLDFAPGSERIVTFPVTVTRTGLHSGVLNVQDDRFEPDNRRFFTFRIDPPLRVLGLIDRSSRQNGIDDPTVWFRYALEGHPRALFQVDVSDIRDFRIDSLASYAAVVLMNVARLDQEQIRALIAYVKGGGGLLLAPADGVDGDAFNRSWGTLAPAHLRRKQVITDGAALAIARVQKHHAIIRTLLEDGTAEFGAARFNGYWVTDPAPESEVILAFENGHAALVEKRADNGRVLLFTSSLDPAWNNFPRQVMYLPMIQEAVRYLAGRRDQKTTYLVGDVAPLMAPEGGVARITSPRGRETLLPSTPTGDAFFDATEQPGFYEIQSGNRSGRFSVNVSPRESNFEPMSPEEIRAWETKSQIGQTIPDAAQVSTLRIKREASQQNWWWLLLLVLALGFFETYLANRTYR